MGRGTKIKDGEVFSRLTVIGADGHYLNPYGANTARKLLCQCSCGEFTHARPSHLKSGAKMSCGCLRAEISSARLKAEPIAKRKYVTVKKVEVPKVPTDAELLINGKW